jgi:hypothetical protein
MSGAWILFDRYVVKDDGEQIHYVYENPRQNLFGPALFAEYIVAKIGHCHP